MHHIHSLTYINCSSNAACEILDLMPDTDLMQELKNLIGTIAYASNLLLINKPLPDSECEELTLYAKEIELGALRMKQAKNTSVIK